MSVLGIDQITYGVQDLDTCRRFMLDWGLELVSEAKDELIFSSLNGCKVVVADAHKSGLSAAIEEGSTLREVVWGVESDADLAAIAGRIQNDPGFVDQSVEGARRVGCTDPNGMAVRFQVSQKKQLDLQSTAMNTWGQQPRVNTPSPIYERAQPIEVGHVVFFVADVNAVEAFYTDRFGFVSSDRYPDRGAFMRCAQNGGHHDLFLLQLTTGKRGLNHVAFTVRDIHEVFGGGMHISRCGWDTQLGPGRHPVSSAYFWYFKNPAGALIEYYADEDQLTGEWEPRNFEPGPTVFAEWAIDGGIDGHTRRQKNVGGPQGQFLTEKELKESMMRLPMPSQRAYTAILSLTLMAGCFAQERTPAQQALASARFYPYLAISCGRLNDVLARTIAAGLTARYGQPAVVENVVGAAGNIGMERVRRAKPDGHTLLVVPAGNITINPSLMPQFPFDLQRDFTPITMLAKTPNLLVVNSQAGIASVQDLIAQAQAKPNAFSYASPGFGSTLHLAGELFKQSAQISLLHVPYRGSGAAVNDVLGGTIAIMFSNLPIALPHLKSGKLKALAVTSAQRSALMPDLPTLQEQGVAGIDVSAWFGLFGPGAMEPEIVLQLSRDATDILARPEVVEQLALQGIASTGSTPAEFASTIHTETATWAAIIKASNMAADELATSQ